MSLSEGNKSPVEEERSLHLLLCTYRGSSPVLQGNGWMLFLEDYSPVSHNTKCHLRPILHTRCQTLHYVPSCLRCSCMSQFLGRLASFLLCRLQSSTLIMKWSYLLPNSSALYYTNVSHSPMSYSHCSIQLTQRSYKFLIQVVLASLVRTFLCSIRCPKMVRSFVIACRAGCSHCRHNTRGGPSSIQRIQFQLYFLVLEFPFLLLRGICTDQSEETWVSVLRILRYSNTTRYNDLI